MEEVIRKVRGRLHTKLFDIDGQLKTLGELIDGVRGGKGGSAIVFGQRESGRSGVVQEAIEKYAKGVIVNNLWLSRLGTDSNALQTLVESETSKDSLIVVVDSADDLVCKSKQALLYRLLDRTKTQPWLVLLLITRQDMTSSLEKRVRSRLSNARVLMGEGIEEEKWWKLFKTLLDPVEERGEENTPPVPVVNTKGGKKGKKKVEEKIEMEGNEKNEEEEKWSEFIDIFLAHPETKRCAQVLYEWSGRLSTLKQVVNVWLVLVEANDVEKTVDGERSESDRQSSLRQLIHWWKYAVEGVVPVKDTITTAIQNIPRRTFCVLVAVARRLRCDPAGAFTYGKIAVDFMHQCNLVDRRMLPSAELSTFKELDRLCQMGILAIVGGTTGLSNSFRQVGLNCSLQLLLSNVRSGCQHSALKDWFDSQPVN